MFAKKKIIERQLIVRGIVHTCRIRRSRKARRLAIHVDIWKGIEAVIPRWVSVASAMRFLQEKEDWIAAQLDYASKLRASTPRRRLVTGESINLLGRNFTLNVTRENSRQRARVLQRDSQIIIQLPAGARVSNALTLWCRAQARKYFKQKSEDFSRILGVTVTAISIGDHRTQWGSAGNKGRLSFNWRLLLAKAEIADYVAAHEVAHLRHHNHSAAFWDTVSLLDPEYKKHRAWLKQYGHTLVL